MKTKSSSNKFSRVLIACALAIVLLLTTWLFVGYVYTYQDDEPRREFFIKKIPYVENGIL